MLESILLPDTDDEEELALREHLAAADRTLRTEAALRLGATYRKSNPRAARMLLTSALEGSNLTQVRALLRLSYISAMDEEDQAQARVYLARAHALSSDLEEESPGNHALIMLRVDIATAFGLLQQLSDAVTMLLYLDKQVQHRRDGADDVGDIWREIAASINLRLGQLVSHYDPDSADVRLKRAITWGSGSIEATAALHRGWLLEHQLRGLGPLTEEHYRHATELGDPLIAPLAHISLGDALWRSGRPDIAREEWQRAAEDGDGTIAARVLSRFHGDWPYGLGEAQPLSAAVTAVNSRPLWVHPPTAIGRIATGRAADDEGASRKRVVIVGAGTGGHYLLPGLQHAYDVVAFVDDDPNVERVGDVEIAGAIDDLEHVIEKFRPIDQIIFAIPTASGLTRNRVLGAAHRCRVNLVTLPNMFELHLGHPLVPQLRSLDVFETFGDFSWCIDREAASFARGRRVAITGAGNGIGRALALRAAHGHARHILLLDESPRPLMKVTTDLCDHRSFTDVDMRIIDCSDKTEMLEAFGEFPPEVVFHCAAVSHIRLPALPTAHAVRANVLSAKVVAEAAQASGARDFLHASTDRAAHRSGPFDWTKTLAECAVKATARSSFDVPEGLHLIEGPHSGFRVRILRLPNIWDRDGAIVGGFVDQLRDGGPIYADPQTRRKFIPSWEAAQALLRLYGSEHPSGLFAYQRGEELDLNTIAEQLIMVHGLTAGRDIQIDRSPRDDTKLGMHLVGNDEIEVGDRAADVVHVKQRQRLEAELNERLEYLIKAGAQDDIDSARRMREESLDLHWPPTARSSPSHGALVSSTDRG